GAYGHHIESFDPNEVIADFRRLCAERRALARRIRAFLDRTAGRLVEQEADLRRFLAEVDGKALNPPRMDRRVPGGRGLAPGARGGPHPARKRLRIAARLDAARARVSGRANK